MFLYEQLDIELELERIQKQMLRAEKYGRALRVTARESKREES
jgi:hypothetical protein